MCYFLKENKYLNNHFYLSILHFTIYALGRGWELLQKGPGRKHLGSIGSLVSAISLNHGGVKK